MVKYNFYTDTYGGTDISEADWKRLSQKAEQRLRCCTFGRLPEEWSAEPWAARADCAVCEIAEQISAAEKRNGKASENTDGYSVSYESSAGSDQQIQSIAQVYLGDTGLLYLGEECLNGHERGFYDF